MMISQQHFDFENFVEKRIGFGKYQWLMICSLIIVQIADGIQAITISLITPILKKQMSLSQNQVSLFTSIFYVGVGIGAIFSGIQSNIHGRKPALIVGIAIQIISGLFLAMRSSFGLLCFFRMLYGMGFGSTLAVSTIIATQGLSMRLRGKGLLIINACNACGKVLGVGIAFIFLQGEQQRWPQYMLSTVPPSLIGLFLCCFCVKQSYRFMLSKNKTAKSMELINQILLINWKNQDNLLNQEQKDQILKWSQKAFLSQHKQANIAKLLWMDIKKVVFLSLSWFFVAFISFGELFIVPFMINNGNHGLIEYFWMTLGQIPSLIVTYFLIDRQGYGRKRSLILFFISSSLFCIYVVISFNSFSLFLAKLIIKATFQMLYPFTSQSYQTKTRSIAFALNSVTGRIGSSIMPFILYPLYVKFPNSPFIILSICSIFGALCICMIKSDTLSKPLDQQQSTDISRGSKIQISLT